MFTECLQKIVSASDNAYSKVINMRADYAKWAAVNAGIGDMLFAHFKTWYPEALPAMEEALTPPVARFVLPVAAPLVLAAIKTLISSQCCPNRTIAHSTESNIAKDSLTMRWSMSYLSILAPNLLAEILQYFNGTPAEIGKAISTESMLSVMPVLKGAAGYFGAGLFSRQLAECWHTDELMETRSLVNGSNAESSV